MNSIEESLRSPTVSSPPAVGWFRPAWAAVLLAAALFGFALSVFTLSYETRDDLNMQMIASGFFTGAPSEHLVFTNVLIGWPLRILYQLWPAVNWYLGYMLAAHLVSLASIAFVVLKRRPGWVGVALFAGFFLIIEPRVLLNLQFTTTAFLAGTAGLLLLVDGLDPSGPVNRRMLVPGIGLVLLSGLIRAPVVPMLAVISAPFVLERLGFKSWRRMLSAGLACVGLVIACFGLDRWYYSRDPAWSEYQRYNQINGRIRVTPLKSGIQEVAPSAGWSPNDAWIFEHWYFADAEVFGPASKLEVLVDHLKSLPRPHRFFDRLPEVFAALPRALGVDAGPALRLALLAGAGCVIFGGTLRIRYLVALVGGYSVCALLTNVLLENAYLPERVAYCIPLFLAASCVYWAARIPRPGPALNRSVPSDSRHLARRVAFAACALVWIGLFAFSLNRWARIVSVISGSNAYLKSEINPVIFEPLRRLLPDGKKPVLVLVDLSSRAAFEDCLFYHPRRVEVPFDLIPYGWVNQSPVFTSALDQHGLIPFSQSLVDRSDVFLSMDLTWVERLKTFYREHYGVEVRFDPALDTDTLPEFKQCGIHLFRARSAGHAQPNWNAGKAGIGG